MYKTFTLDHCVYIVNGKIRGKMSIIKNQTDCCFNKKYSSSQVLFSCIVTSQYSVLVVLSHDLIDVGLEGFQHGAQTIDVDRVRVRYRPLEQFCCNNFIQLQILVKHILLWCQLQNTVFRS